MPTLSPFNAKFNLEWQEITYDKLISAIPIEWRTLIQSNTGTTFIQYQQLLYTAKSIKTFCRKIDLCVINRHIVHSKNSYSVV